MGKTSLSLEKNPKVIFLFTAIIVSILMSFVIFGCNLEQEKPKRFTLVYSVGTGGTLNGNVNQTVESGKSGTEITAVSDAGYRFVKWSDNDSTNPKRTDKNVTAAINATAIFEKQIFSVKYITNGNGTIEGNANQRVIYRGDGTMVEAVPNTGCKFIKWSDNDSTNPKRTDTNVTTTIAVIAIFEKQSFMAEYNTDGNGTISGNSEQTVPYGEYSRTVLAQPNEGCLFVSWSDGKTEQTRSDLITKDLIVTAFFRNIYSGGNGLPSAPYLIGSYEELTSIALFPAASFRLTCDLDLKGIAHVPMFDYDDPFNGIFDGGGFTVSNMKVNVHHQYSSLFGLIKHGSVKNLNITDFEIIVPNRSNTFVGAVCGDTVGSLENINVSGKITTERLEYNYISIGGLTGRAQNTVTNCHADVEINLQNVASGNGFMTGGLVGCSSGKEGYCIINMASCSAAGSIDINFTADKGGGMIGGLIAYLEYARNYTAEPSDDESDNGVHVSGSYSKVNITSDYQVNCGGLIAVASVNTSLDITDCYTTGNITLESGAAGGLLCTAGDNLRLITNCYTTGNITAGFATGFIYRIQTSSGKIANIIDCFTSGNIMSKSRAAGFCTEASSSINFYRCYAIGNVQGEEASGFVFNWPGSINWQEGIFCVMEECFSTGTVTAKQNAVGLIYFTGAKIKNCYSTSDIYLIVDKEGYVPVLVAGLIALFMRGSVSNCYYSGTIYIPAQINPLYIGAICAEFDANETLGGSIINCHWLKAEQSEEYISYEAIGSDRHETQPIETTQYNNITDMYLLADALNADATDPVWINIPGKTPKLKFLQKEVARII